MSWPLISKVFRALCPRAVGEWDSKMAVEPFSKRGEEGAGIIDRDGLDFAGILVDAFLDEGLGSWRRRRVMSPLIQRAQSDVVCEEVAGDAGASSGGIESPRGRLRLGGRSSDMVQSCRKLARGSGRCVRGRHERRFVWRG